MLIEQPNDENGRGRAGDGARKSLTCMAETGTVPGKGASMPLSKRLAIASVYLITLASMAACGEVAALSSPSPVAEARAKDEPKTTGCNRVTIIDPPTMEGMPGAWFQSDPDGDLEPPPEGCPAGYPLWTISPAGTRFKVYHRPHDAAHGNDDPERLGNWAVITNPTAGASYTIRTEYGAYSTEILWTAALIR